MKVGIKEGLKHESCIACDELMSLPKNMLTNYIGKLNNDKMSELNKSLVISIGIF